MQQSIKESIINGYGCRKGSLAINKECYLNENTAFFIIKLYKIIGRVDKMEEH